jgi:hypothetical protein
VHETHNTRKKMKTNKSSRCDRTPIQVFFFLSQEVLGETYQTPAQNHETSSKILPMKTGATGQGGAQMGEAEERVSEKSQMREAVEGRWKGRERV